MNHPNIRIGVILSQPFAENTYIAHLPESDRCVIFDPGFEPAPVIEYVLQHGLEPAAILNTHGHSDHIGGNRAMKQQWPACPLVIGHGDAPKLTDPHQNLSAGYGVSVTSPAADALVAEGDVYSAAGLDLNVAEIAGHSSGHVVFIWQASPPFIVFGGDVLFAGSIGRTDFPDGSFPALVEGIHKKLFTLPDDTIVLPGHGPATTIGAEKRDNPFIGQPAGYSFD